MTLQGLSQTDTVRIPQDSSNKPICLPSDIMHKVARDLVNGDFCAKQLANRNNEIILLSKEMLLKDNVIEDQAKIIKNDSVIKLANINLLNDANARTDEYKIRYRVIKINDRIKMGVGATVIVGLIYGWVTKK